MITQVIWTDVNNRELDNIYARMGDDEIREIQFIICRNDPPEKVAIPAGVSGQFRMVKSSGNFVVRDMVKTVHEDGTVIFTVAVSDQMVNVQGTGYYDIRLSGGGYLYTASGRFIVDTPVISSAVLEDVSEVNGLVFPDDFLTTEDHFATIDDTIISSSSVWSSYKTNDAIEEAIESIPSPIKEYGTTPKIIAKWIDGRNVYEYVKQISISIPASGSTTDVSFSEVPSNASILSVSAINNNVGWGSGGMNQCVPCFCMQWNGYPNVGIAQFSPWAFSCTHLIIQYIAN